MKRVKIEKRTQLTPTYKEVCDVLSTVSTRFTTTVKHVYTFVKQILKNVSIFALTVP